ncbi:MAG: YraN family protein [Caulobacterales bacterium]
MSKTRRAAERRGRAAEMIAALWLMAKGYRILGQRLRTPFGEVDLAALRKGVLVIVEVKARASKDAGLYAVTPMAQDRIARAATMLAGRWRLNALPIRFDVVIVGAGLWPKHVLNAWDVSLAKHS